MTSILQSIHLLESLSHLEDLEVNKFIDTIENISKFIATEKLDGFNLRFGLDPDGKFYTSREGKGSTDINYKASQYENNPPQVKFKAAHLGLQNVVDKIKKVLEPGEAVEVEVLFGRQPNMVTYGIGGKNFIAFLRSVEGTDKNKKPDQSKIEILEKELNNDEVTINVKTFDTDDGVNLKEVPTDITWKFVSTQKIDTVDLKKLDFKKEIKKLKSFLNEKDEVASKLGLDMTVFDIISVNLIKIPKEKREEIKKERDFQKENVLNNFMLPIKNSILDNFLRKTKPKLQDKNVSSDEDLGMEGIVLLDPETQDQIKIVDKDIFTAVNQFNWSIRNNISGMVKSTDPMADAAIRGGLFGDAKIRIGGLFGMPNLARTMDVKKVFRKFKGETPTDTLNNFVKNLSNIKFQDVKTKIISILKSTVDDVNKELKTFKDENDKYKLTLKNGKTVGYTQEVIKRTLVAFAELNKDLSELLSTVKKSKNINHLIGALYGKAIEDIHNESSITECLVMESNAIFANDRKQLTKMSTEQIGNAYTSTLLGSLLLLKNNIKDVKRILGDPDGAALKKYKKDMSPLNFWGLVMFHPDHKDIKPYLRPEVLKELKDISGTFLTSRIRAIHSTLGAANILNVNWRVQFHNMRVVTLRLNNRTNNINIIRNGIDKWDELSLEDKNVVIQKTFGLMMQYIPNSPLVNLIRKLSDKVLTTANTNMDTKPSLIKDVMKIIKLKEDEGGGEPAGPAGPAETGPVGPDTATTSSEAIGSKPVRIFKGKIIKRVQRTYKKIPKIRAFSLNKK